MKKISKFVSVILSILMVISIIPMSGITAYAETKTGICGKNLRYVFDYETGVLAITGNGDMYSPQYPSAGRFAGIAKDIKTVIFEGEITSIGDYAFYECVNLEGITIPDTVTKIGEEAFLHCEKLESITIPDSVATIGFEAFGCCSSAKTLKIGNGLEKISPYAFIYCTSLKDVVIPENVKAIEYCAFFECEGIEKITLPEGLNSIGWAAFSVCTSLKSLYIPASVTKIGDEMTTGCTSLTEIIVDEKNNHYCSDEDGVLFDYNKKVLMQFPAGSEITNYEIPHHVTKIANGAFYGSKITEIAIPDYVETIGSSAFDSCYALEKVYISCETTLIDYDAFYECTNLKDVYYTGHQNQWKCINIREDNSCLLNANIHYSYYCTEHTMSDWIIVDLQCEGNEQKARYCLYCDENEIRQTGNTLDHNFSEWNTDIETTCTTNGEESRFCLKCHESETRLVDAKGHNYESVVTAPTCTEQGYTTYTCDCGDSYVSDYADALGHNPANAVEENFVAPTCTENGSKDVVVYCSVCEEEISRETVILEATNHADNDDDGYCDACTELLDPTVECDCNCHRDGIISFVWKLINFINKLFGLNNICDCGVAHY